MTFYFDILNTRGRILLLDPASFYLNYVYLVLIQPIGFSSMDAPTNSILRFFGTVFIEILFRMEITILTML